MSCRRAMTFAARDARRFAAGFPGTRRTPARARGWRCSGRGPRAHRAAGVLGGRVAPLDMVRAVQDHHAVGQRLHGAPHASERVGQGFLAPRRVRSKRCRPASASSQTPSPSGTCPGADARARNAQSRQVACMPKKKRDEAGAHTPAPAAMADDQRYGAQTPPSARSVWR